MTEISHDQMVTKVRNCESDMSLTIDGETFTVVAAAAPEPAPVPTVEEAEVEPEPTVAEVEAEVTEELASE